MQTKELMIPIKSETKELFTEAGVDAVLSAVDQEIAKFKTPSVETKKGRDAIKSFKMKITKTRTFLEKQGKEFIAEKKAAIKIFDSGRKKLRDGLAEREIEVRKPLTKYEEAEKARIEAERQQEIFNMDHEEALSMNDLLNRERAIAEKEAEFARVEEERRQKEEAERVEKERLEREKRIAQEAKEQARKQAEAKAAQEKAEAERKVRAAEEAKEKAERERIAAGERARVEKEQAIKKAEDEAEAKSIAEREARERQAAQEKAEAERKAANRNHQAKIDREVLSCLMEVGLTEEIGRELICKIKKREIKHVSINY